MEKKELRETILNYSNCLREINWETIKYDGNKRVVEDKIFILNNEVQLCEALATENAVTTKLKKNVVKNKMIFNIDVNDYQHGVDDFSQNKYVNYDQLVEQKFANFKNVNIDSNIKDEINKKIKNLSLEGRGISNLEKDILEFNKEISKVSLKSVIPALISSIYVALYFLTSYLTEEEDFYLSDVYLTFLLSGFFVFMGVFVFEILQKRPNYIYKEVKKGIDQKINNYNKINNDLYKYIYEKVIIPNYKELNDNYEVEKENLYNEYLNNVTLIKEKYDYVTLPLSIQNLYDGLEPKYQDLFIKLGMNAETEKDFNEIYLHCLAEQRENDKANEYKKQTEEMKKQTEVLKEEAENKAREEALRTQMLAEYQKEQTLLLEKNNELQRQANKNQEAYNKKRMEEAKKQSESLNRIRDIEEYDYNKKYN